MVDNVSITVHSVKSILLAGQKSYATTLISSVASLAEWNILGF